MNAQILDQRLSELAAAGHKVQHVVRNAGLVQQLDARKPVIGVCSAGLATTVLPAASAAAICPVKIAIGKFHGEMHANGPRPRSVNVFSSPVGPLRMTEPEKSRRASVA